MEVLSRTFYENSELLCYDQAVLSVMGAQFLLDQCLVRWGLTDRVLVSVTGSSEHVCAEASPWPQCGDAGRGASLSFVKKRSGIKPGPLPKEGSALPRERFLVCSGVWLTPFFFFPTWGRYFGPRFWGLNCLVIIKTHVFPRPLPQTPVHSGCAQKICGLPIQ